MGSIVQRDQVRRCIIDFDRVIIILECLVLSPELVHPETTDGLIVARRCPPQSYLAVHPHTHLCLRLCSAHFLQAPVASRSRVICRYHGSLGVYGVRKQLHFSMVATF